MAQLDFSGVAYGHPEVDTVQQFERWIIRLHIRLQFLLKRGRPIGDNRAGELADSLPWQIVVRTSGRTNYLAFIRRPGGSSPTAGEQDSRH